MLWRRQLDSWSDADFPGLPPGVTLPGASGTDSSGNPYVNMHDAIAPGGLGMGATSEPVPITLSDPSLVRFALAPRILSTGPELPPVLAAIAPLTVMPGQVINVPLQATDPNGDPITFTLQSSGALPTSTLQPGGTLLIAPAPSDVGTLTRGAGTNARFIRNVLPETAEAESLLVVEVITPGGNWSSYPPHKHDRDALPDESYLEETYYHRLKPAQCPSNHQQRRQHAARSSRPERHSPNKPLHQQHAQNRLGCDAALE